MTGTAPRRVRQDPGRRSICQAGVLMIGRFTNPDGTNYVEPGLMELLERMRTGRFKVFEHLKPWFEEFRRYHRKKGKIHKEFDDLMDATRYAAISVTRFGQNQAEMESTRSRRIHVP